MNMQEVSRQLGRLMQANMRSDGYRTSRELENLLDLMRDDLIEVDFEAGAEEIHQEQIAREAKLYALPKNQ